MLSVRRLSSMILLPLAFLAILTNFIVFVFHVGLLKAVCTRHVSFAFLSVCVWFPDITSIFDASGMVCVRVEPVSILTLQTHCSESLLLKRRPYQTHQKRTWRHKIRRMHPKNAEDACRARMYTDSEMIIIRFADWISGRKVPAFKRNRIQIWISETLLSMFPRFRLLEKVAHCTIIHSLSSEASFQPSVPWLRVCLWLNLCT